MYTGDLNMVDHTGSTRTFNSNTYLIPADDLGIIIVSNEGTSGNDYGVLAKALYSLYKIGVLPTNEPFTDYYIPPQEDDIQSALKENKLSFILNVEPLPYPIDNYAGIIFLITLGKSKLKKNKKIAF